MGFLGDLILVYPIRFVPKIALNKRLRSQIARVKTFVRTALFCFQIHFLAFCNQDAQVVAISYLRIGPSEL